MWQLGHKKGWAPKNLCFWTVVLQKTFESPLDYKEIKPVDPKWNKSCISIGRTDAEAEILIFWPPDAKNWLIGKEPDAGKDWRLEEKGTTENEMIVWYHRLHGHEFEPAPGIGDRQRSLTVHMQSTGSQRIRHNCAIELNWVQFKGRWQAPFPGIIKTYSVLLPSMLLAKLKERESRMVDSRSWREEE